MPNDNHPSSTAARLSLLHGVIDNPSDSVRKLVFADWLDDEGKPDQAYAFRWVAGLGLHPRVTPARGWSSWRKIPAKPPRFLLPHFLPRVVWDELSTWGKVPHVRTHHSTRQYGSFEVAFLRLAEALARLRGVIEVKPVK